MISVIMPVYNTEDYLSQAVNSVVEQTYGDWELIAVDDGSTDGSGRILDDWAAKEKRIRVFHTENAGMSAARNIGLEKMRGDIVQFIDSDDWLDPTALQEVAAALSKQGVDMVIYDVWCEGDDEGKRFCFQSPVPEGIYEPQDILRFIAEPAIPSWVWNKPCRSCLYKGVRFPEGDKWEDTGMIFYPVDKAEKIEVLSKPLYHYRVLRLGSATKEGKDDHSRHMWRFVQFRKQYEFLKENYPAIADGAKTVLLKKGLLYYAFFFKVLEAEERRELKRYLCSEEFSRGINWKARTARSLFRFFPRTVSHMLRLREASRFSNDSMVAQR